MLQVRSSALHLQFLLGLGEEEWKALEGDVVTHRDGKEKGGSGCKRVLRTLYVLFQLKSCAVPWKTHSLFRQTCHQLML